MEGVGVPDNNHRKSASLPRDDPIASIIQTSNVVLMLIEVDLVILPALLGVGKHDAQSCLVVDYLVFAVEA